MMVLTKRPLLPVGIGAASLLIVALFDMPREYYTCLRFVVCGAAIWTAAFCRQRKRNAHAIPFVVIALIFNPVLIPRLERFQWEFFDMFSAIFFVYFAFLAPPRLGPVYCEDRGEFDTSVKACADAIELGEDDEEGEDDTSEGTPANMPAPSPASPDESAVAVAGIRDRRIEALKDIIKVNPDSAEAHYNLAVAYYRLASEWVCWGLGEFHRQMRFGDYPGFARDCYADALKECEQAIRIRPDYAAAHNILGAIYPAFGCQREAIDACKEAIRIAPDSAATHFNMGLIFRECGDIHSALKECRILKSMDPKRADSLLALTYTWNLPGPFSL